MSRPQPQALFARIETTSRDAALRSRLERCQQHHTAALVIAPAGGSASVGLHQPVDATLDELTPGQRVGRFVLLQRLAAGGMGVVYAAIDPQLNRKVALKLIRRVSDANDADTSQRQERLVREAQAMARVTHPNVVAIHELGREADRVFIAMQFLDGETMARWLADETRSLAEIVHGFVGAGRGLAATHAAGLAHRDFKPDNVMIAGDGRVWLIDLGLARPLGAREPSAMSPLPSQARATLTGAGVLLGTPAYMAPEQLAREPADAGSDQFAFCVALYEGLCRTRPFIADDTEGLRVAILEQKLRAPRRNVPSALLQIVTRGLQPFPGARWPSMAVLTRALARWLKERPRR